MRGLHIRLALGVLAAGMAGLSSPVLADDPHDPAMRHAEARARDKAMIRRLNLDQAAYVRQRDAQYARENAESRSRAAGGDQSHDAAMREYEAAMADWRRDVAACRSGEYTRCHR